MAIINEIRMRLEAAFEGCECEVVDESAGHTNHAGAQSGGGHYFVWIKSPLFAGQSRVVQHRLVYTALGELMQGPIHALRLETEDESTRGC